MNIVLRLFLAVAAVGVLALVVRKVHKSEMQTGDSVFWVLFAGSFVILALFPQVAYFFSSVLGFASPSNFIFLYTIGILVLQCFLLTAKVAHLRMKVNTLVQELALREHEQRKSEGRGLAKRMRGADELLPVGLLVFYVDALLAEHGTESLEKHFHVEREADVVHVVHVEF